MYTATLLKGLKERRNIAMKNPKANQLFAYLSRNEWLPYTIIELIYSGYEKCLHIAVFEIKNETQKLTTKKWLTEKLRCVEIIFVATEKVDNIILNCN